MTAARIEFVGDDCAADWDGYVTNNPAAALYHRYAWRDVFRKTFRRETYYLAAYGTAGEICGVLPLVRLSSLIFGDFLISLPYFNYGGVLGASGPIIDALLDRAAEFGRSLGVKHIEFRHSRNVRAGWPVRLDKVTMTLDIGGGPEQLWKSFTPKVRAQVKRPQRDGGVAALGGQELLGEFHAVMAQNMRDLGTPVYPRRFFEAVLALVGESARIAVVRLAGKPVAAGLTLRHGTRLEIPWASSLRSANRSGVNMLLYWSLLEHAASTGVTQFDFGRCTPESGTFRFKQQWGAKPEQLYWHYWLREGTEPPLLNPQNPKYHAAVELWKKLPVPVATWVGGRLIGNLP